MLKNYYEYDGSKPTVKEHGNKPKKEGFFSKIDKWQVAKTVASAVASGCATMAVNKFLKANMPVTRGTIDKAITDIGLYFVTGFVGSKVAEYCDNELDTIKNALFDKSSLENEETENGQ